MDNMFNDRVNAACSYSVPADQGLLHRSCSGVTSLS